ncbi:hypothetical protein L596_023826 [Steinernema carpocapsae]|uniref:Kazal-like domain-containing protein n=1 Tax=Steinernema carpocapsae TaxID=34508 RepID=A0A4U5MEV8_STECR|nr:hypothetical protein L596_023826 [Steinernema carpocapsae]
MNIYLLPFAWLCFLAQLHVTGALRPRSIDESPCQVGTRPGDCNPASCGGYTCEARYVRFWDPQLQADRTSKSCQCMEEPICGVIGMNAYSGCRTYAYLSPAGQKMIRLWSMTSRERQSRHALTRSRFSDSERYSDRVRHKQLLLANTRFCCRTIIRRRAEASVSIRRFAPAPLLFTSLAIPLLFSALLPIFCQG